MYVLEISLLVIIIILLISNYAYQPKLTRVNPQYQIADQVNCQDCFPSTKVKCESCPVNCHECVNCAPNCDLCKTDCQKCKTGTCQPSCDTCLTSTCIPDCKKCSQSCSLDCSRLRKCTLPFEECKFVAQSLSFNLTGYATYKTSLLMYNMNLKIVSGKNEGHITTLVGQKNIISIFIVDRFVAFNANINDEKVTFIMNEGGIKLLEPNLIVLIINENTILVRVNGFQFEKSFPGGIPLEKYTIHLGGVPYNQRARAYFTGTYYHGFTGCITDIKFNGSQKSPMEFFLQDANLGCPRKFITNLK